MMKNRQCVPILLTLKRVEVGVTSNNIKAMILRVYTHVHHFHEIEMLHTMKVACSKAATELCLSCLIGSLMLRSWPLLAWCTHSNGCVKKLLRKTSRFI